jgi:hypothetical protein
VQDTEREGWESALKISVQYRQLASSWMLNVPPLPFMHRKLETVYQLTINRQRSVELSRYLPPGLGPSSVTIAIESTSAPMAYHCEMAMVYHGAYVPW